ncbi:hypothetical protein CcaverHIS002_0503860 [Cutaneotrichosporon cavernicola]|uniref:Uncharacterized protein n=1 Tax=Cutaneotrichosporon cavernicola TaxID=279322 RepID=A0AA48L6G9_9TREE|nr:uncharacterized protein CcaverHIS019_0504430 [Cutaneotrichosporon cavernicola]BEI84985.1 hypothetical protein CcaverHIS002_0503860 [Cutaneotrichosporon cavernicola]BEI92815.1 hypothetical protein CcaverHIS019_0504430 [Cutaneotrichosporon cavernicola]BEJ00591.1 hypothetical protein CcaverHIS631_0504480 [Cutaneotrichosporon cavernicola]BEJ08359.1 hypothetical protein CcaverHIS641_0504440 [Cutaneotrichosporon cavernicola]
MTSSTLKLVSWDDYCGVHGSTDEPNADHDVFDADASSDEETDAGDNDIPALRATATPTFTLGSYFSTPARSSTSDLYRAINVPTFALVRGSPRKGDRAPPRPTTSSLRLNGSASGASHGSSVGPYTMTKTNVNADNNVDSSTSHVDRNTGATHIHTSMTKTNTYVHADANPRDIPSCQPKVLKLTLPKKRRVKRVDNPAKHAKHAPKRRPLQAKVANAA